MRTRAVTIGLSTLIGIGLGALSGRILFGGSVWNLIPWAVVAMVIGLVAQSLGSAALASGGYGYSLVAMFLFVANAGDQSFGERTLFAVALALVGPVCSIPLSLTALLLRRRARRERGS
ncbi:hypothetical protein BH11ACT3_BH11ACT3_21820 [soil metagenome]